MLVLHWDNTEHRFNQMPWDQLWLQIVYCDATEETTNTESMKSMI